ncbi:MAG: S41 family peptidase, partial [Lysobacteraceae bacterium]
KRFGMFIVISTLPDSPAARAELLTGDMLESVAGFSSRGMSIEQARLLLAGEPGTGVTLSVVRQRRTEPFQLELIRARVRPTEVVSTTLEDDIAYLKVASFTPGKAEEIGRALIRLEAAGARKLILDLRWCASGEAEEGIETARLLLEDGSVGYLQGQQYSRQDFPAHPDQTLWRGPVSVLINVGTAGPAELLAAAVLDNQRGEVIGERSYGVGALQKLIPLDDGAALILSVAKYYRPSGEAIQGNAVTPSIAIERPDGEEALRPLRHAPPAPGDPVVLKALDVLRAASVEQPAKKAA